MNGMVIHIPAIEKNAMKIDDDYPSGYLRILCFKSQEWEIVVGVLLTGHLSGYKHLLGCKSPLMNSILSIALRNSGC